MLILIPNSDKNFAHCMTGETEYDCAVCNIQNPLLKSNLTAIVFLLFTLISLL